ncbi:MAG TPA: COX15/CtaA family protein [Acidimicrobiales bacterium]|nr:COX15/CtaA family protein [Acidimicrobiales bacterium]
MRGFRLSPLGYRRVTLVALFLLAFIIVTGGAVRITGSGLGCPDWPNCDDGRLVAPLEYHAMVEFVNRTVTGLVSLVVMLAVLGSLVRQPRRRDLVWLSLGLVAGVLGQIVLGGLTVLFELRPPFVMAHFLLSMVIVADAVVLHWRAGRSYEPGPPVVSGDVRRLRSLIVATTALVIFLGTVVTAAGPHGGDETADRLDVPLHRAAQLHGSAVVLLLAMVVAMLVLLHRTGAPPDVRRRGAVLLGVLVAQAGVGYVQYFTGVPVVLVGIHIAGATAVWVAVLRFSLGLTPTAPAEESAGRPLEALVGA